MQQPQIHEGDFLENVEGTYEAQEAEILTGKPKDLPKVRRTISGKKIPYTQPYGTWGEARRVARTGPLRTGEFYQREFPVPAVVALVEHQEMNRQQRRYYGIKGQGTNQPYRKTQVNMFGDPVDANGQLLAQAQDALARSGQ
jgi:hypothetical protein